MIRRTIIKYGRVKSVIFLTCIFTLLTLLLISLLSNVFLSLDINYNYNVLYFTAFLIPLCITPLPGWYLVDQIHVLHHQEEKARKLSTYDSLTGLLNRHSFLEGAKHFFYLSERNKENFAVLIIDFDNFKKINDQYGHLAGDEVLKTFGNTAQRIARASDLIGRIGGEEFAILLPQTSQKNAYIFAERLRTTIHNTIVPYQGTLIRFSISIGIAENCINETKSFNEILDLADKALYISKENGRNQTSMFSQSISNLMII